MTLPARSATADVVVHHMAQGDSIVGVAFPDGRDGLRTRALVSARGRGLIQFA